MNLGDILSPQRIVPNLQAIDRWLAIDELIAQLVTSGSIPREHAESISAAVKKRERKMSTGIGFGIGIPHASTEVIKEVTGVLGRSTKGVEFGALDDQPVHLVMLFLVPDGQFQKHLHTLANIAKVLRNDDFHASIRTAPDQESMMKIIRQFSMDVR